MFRQRCYEIFCCGIPPQKLQKRLSCGFASADYFGKVIVSATGEIPSMHRIMSPSGGKAEKSGKKTP